MKPTSFVLVYLFSSWLLPGTEAQVAPPAAYEGSMNTGSLYGALDETCILRTWRIVGILACPAFPSGVNVCPIIENAYPVGILESVRRPYSSHLSEGEAYLKPMKAAQAFGKSSSHTTDQGSGTALQFTEAHVFQFVPQLGLDGEFAVPSGLPYPVIAYSSELDGYSWRTGLGDFLAQPELALRKALPSCSLAPAPQTCAWTWGSYFPRIGFAQHPSEVMAAHLLALRAGRVASMPGARVALGNYPFEPRTGHYLQLLRPAWRSCVPIGWPVTRMIEAGALSPEGAYLLVHFGLFRVCNGCLPTTLVEPRPPSP